MSVRLYYPEPLTGIEVHPIFHYLYPPANKGGGLFRDVKYSFFKEAETPDSKSADAIVLVNNFAKELDAEAKEYLKKYADTAERLSKPLFIFSCGDFTDSLRFDSRIWVFRQSLYKSSMESRDICIPTTTEDPPKELLFIRNKNKKPIVAFCGMGGFSSVRSWIKYHAENLFYECVALLKPEMRAKKLGVYWRRAMMRACERSPLVETNFIVRRSFSGHEKSIELNPKQARREYLETTANADFVLAPKGDGNYSNRFLKTLAFGRIPVLVDTDVVLPLEEKIDYSKIIVRVPMRQVENTANYICEFYGALTEEEWKNRQSLARETFEQYLKQDVFFRNFFTKEFSNKHV